MLFFHPKNTEQTEFPLPALHNKAVYIKQDDKHKEDTYKKQIRTSMYMISPPFIPLSTTMTDTELRT